MRMPCTKVPCLPIFSGRCRFADRRRAPPPVHADQLEQNDIAREAVLQASPVMALPPYLMTMVLPW
jgi:hypothetical protein